ncbi:MAG: PepSY domain-containing protein [Gammaproteobacteria bacterium]
MKKFLPAVAAAALYFSTPAMAEDGTLGDCIKAAMAKQKGNFVKVEYLSKSAKGVPTFELELRDANGVEHEFMCDATSGQLYEAETEVDIPSDSKFKKNAKVGEEEAMAIATKAHPGEVVEVEYEIESDGGSTYEFDIIGKDGKETKVEVDAATGKIIEVHVEEWEIGEEPEEKRKK